MKKYLLFLLVSSCFTLSCKKAHHSDPDPDPKTYSVNFSLSGFRQAIASAPGSKQVNGIKTNATPTPVTADYFKMIHYRVYNTINTHYSLFHSLSIDSSASNFGTISDRLPAGNYTVGIAAGMAGLKFDERVFNTAGDVTSGISYGYANPQNLAWKDAFFDKFELTVSGDINQNVTLSRVVGQLEVNIEDAIPVNAKTIAVTVTNDAFYYVFNTEQPEMTRPMTFTTLIPDVAKGKPNFKVSSLIANTVAPFVVKITCYDANQKNIGPGVTVPNVTCQKNTRTILSGKLFDYSSFDTFTIGINNDWDPTPIVIHY